MYESHQIAVVWGQEANTKKPSLTWWLNLSQVRRSIAGYYSASASNAMLIVTSSPTAGTKRSIPKSLRKIVVVALAPIASFLNIGFSALWKWVTSSTTGLVMPLMVNSPSIVLGASASNVTFDDLNVAVGNYSVSNKSADLICASKSAKPVLMAVISRVISTSAVLASLS